MDKKRELVCQLLDVVNKFIDDLECDLEGEELRPYEESIKEIKERLSKVEDAFGY